MQWRETRKYSSIVAYSATWFLYSYGSYSLSIILAFFFLKEFVYLHWKRNRRFLWRKRSKSVRFSSSLPSEIESRSHLNSESGPAFRLDPLLMMIFLYYYYGFYYYYYEECEGPSREVSTLVVEASLTIKFDSLRIVIRRIVGCPNFFNFGASWTLGYILVFSLKQIFWSYFFHKTNLLFNWNNPSSLFRGMQKQSKFVKRLPKTFVKFSYKEKKILKMTRQSLDSTLRWVISMI